ncbi:tRNA dimethylallyltransferase [Variibacter gotjawalensis]|uniref:tRNA dimethylallyltransferase n=1 Tax=Variibacter gotjawalensis TaxID=1333996 RepID=A0A0S3PTR8_9BRAD|nr:tRNA dimethylallyltransferase [Variibacter gotjawalensis]BAT59361.1 tRNA dimethylallyltransferase [Variibacter gotjawalensis]
MLIAGPTASGKSALAIAVAERFGGRIINADSMQVYADLRVITARPTPDEEAQVPHVMYGWIDAAVNYSAGQWLRDAEQELETCRRDGVRPIIVGGTGLYFKLLTSGIAAIPPIPEEIRQSVRARIEREGSQALHAELAVGDPEAAARLHTSDGSRIVRAIEVLEATGRTLSDWQRENAPPILDGANTACVFVDCDRDDLAGRIGRRFDQMLEQGALDEVKALGERKLDPALPAMKAHGVPWLIKYFDGKISLADAASHGKLETLQYTKRQRTWARNQFPDWPWETSETALGSVARQL